MLFFNLQEFLRNTISFVLTINDAGKRDMYLKVPDNPNHSFRVTFYVILKLYLVKPGESDEMSFATVKNPL